MNQFTKDELARAERRKSDYRIWLGRALNDRSMTEEDVDHYAAKLDLATRDVDRINQYGYHAAVLVEARRRGVPGAQKHLDALANERPVAIHEAIERG